MCTALHHPCAGGWFARNLDLQHVYGECVTITPRHLPLAFWNKPPLEAHYAMIGTALVQQEQPLYFEAVNERGLAMAALSFERTCAYAPPLCDKDSIAPFEMISWVLSQCADVKEAVGLLRDRRVAAVAFDEALPVTPLHWMLCDAASCVAVEPLEDGLHVVDDPVGVLTNSPSLSYHLTYLSEYANLRREEPTASFYDGAVTAHHRGYGLKGLPGDFTSSSRFVRASVIKAATPLTSDAERAMTDCFHILDTVAVPRGCLIAADGKLAVTQYSCACHLPSGRYYYKTYDAPTVRLVTMQGDCLDGASLQCVAM